MRKIRAALSALLICALSLGLLSGCEARDETPGIYLVADDTEGYYWENLIDGATAAAEDLGWKIEVVRYDALVDMQAHWDAASERGDEYIVTALSTEEPRMTALNTAGAEKPELVVLGKNIDEAPASLRIVFDQSNAGKSLGRRVAGQIGLQKSYLMVADTEDYRYWDDWEVELRTALGAQGSCVLRRINCDGDEQTAYTQCAMALSLLGDRIDGIICVGQMGTRGAIRAQRERRLDIPIIGAEFDDEIALGLRDGLVQCTFVHSAYGCGYMGIERAVNAYEGRETESIVRLESLCIDADNMFDENLLPVLYKIR